MVSEALQFVGTYSDVNEVNDTFAAARECSFLISPVTSIASIQPGCVISITAIQFSEEKDAHEAYEVIGGMALHRTSLLRLANAAGIVWDERASQRTDDGRDPHFVEWHVSGARPDLDGSSLLVPGDGACDLREGSVKVLELRASAKARDGKSAEDVARILVAAARSKIVQLAVSNAQQRAIVQALAIGPIPKGAIAAKPFLVARLRWVGDPKSAEDRAAIRERALGGAIALFGARPAPALRAHEPSPPPAAPPKPPARPVFDAEFEDAPRGKPAATSQAAKPAAAAPAPKPPEEAPAFDPNGPCAHCGAKPAEARVDTLTGTRGSVRCCRKPACRERGREAAGTAAPAKASAPSGGVVAGEWVFKFGRWIKGLPLSQGSDEDLRYYEGAIRDSLSDPSKQQWRDGNERTLAAIAAEWQRRDARSRPQRQAVNGGTSRGSEPATDEEIDEILNNDRLSF